MNKWYADFKYVTNVTTLNRAQWDEKRDYVVEFFAGDEEEARGIAFILVRVHCSIPKIDGYASDIYLGSLKQVA